MALNNLPNIGDIITSPKFAYGYYQSEKKRRVLIDGITTSRKVTATFSEEQRVIAAAKTGEIPPKAKVVELGAHDPTRATAKFVVERAVMEGGSDHWRDSYPDGWHVTARRLNEDDSYDENNEVIDFFMSGCFCNMITPENIKIVSKTQVLPN